MFTVHEDAGPAPHFAIEELHAQLLPPVRMRGEFLPGTEEMAVGTDLQLQPQPTGRRPQVLLHTPLTRFDNDQSLRTQALRDGNQFRGERTRIVRVFQRPVVNGEVALVQRIAEVPHGREEEGDAGLVGPHVRGFLHHLCHPDGVKRRVEAVERSRSCVQLVAEHQDQRTQWGCHVVATRDGTLRKPPPSRHPRPPLGGLPRFDRVTTWRDTVSWFRTHSLVGGPGYGAWPSGTGDRI